jgi:single-stranded DNA-binding protein
MSIEVALFGTLGRDAEAKTSKSGKSYLRFSVHTGDGDTAQWISVMLFGDDVPDLAPKLVKGSRVYIEGSIKLDEWTAQDGTKRYGLNVMSWRCRLAAIGQNKPKRATNAAKSHRRPHRRVALASTTMKFPLVQSFVDAATSHGSRHVDNGPAPAII